MGHCPWHACYAGALQALCGIQRADLSGSHTMPAAVVGALALQQYSNSNLL